MTGNGHVKLEWHNKTEKDKAAAVAVAADAVEMLLPRSSAVAVAVGQR